MKYLATLIAGLAAGALLALGVLYVNPFTAAGAPDLEADHWSLGYDFPGDALLVSHSGRLPLPVMPVGTDRLWERTLRRSLVKVVVLKDDEGVPVGAASRVSLASPDSDLLRRGLIVNDYWLVTVPGEGTLAVRSDSNVWPLLKEAALPVWYLGRQWDEPASFGLTEGPEARGLASVHGVTGTFAGSDGRGFTRYELLDLDTRGASFLGRLHLRLAEAAASADEQAAVPRRGIRYVRLLQ